MPPYLSLNFSPADANCKVEKMFVKPPKDCADFWDENPWCNDMELEIRKLNEDQMQIVNNFLSGGKSHHLLCSIETTEALKPFLPKALDPETFEKTLSALDENVVNKEQSDSTMAQRAQVGVFSISVRTWFLTTHHYKNRVLQQSYRGGHDTSAFSCNPVVPQCLSVTSL